MTDLSRLTSNGFSIPDKGGRLIDLSLLSLKIALQSFFSTYQSMWYSLQVFDDISNSDDFDHVHGFPYLQACSESIVHFQHFTELFIKEALRKEHPLLVNEASSEPLMLYKLVKGNRIKPHELEKVNTIEFRDAFKRFMCLLNNGKIKDTELQVVKKYEEPLKKLNILRNRMWHRGTFILRYPALDEYIGKYILPFVKDVLSIKIYSRLTDIWKYNQLHCSIDPIDEIINTFKSNTYSVGKIALLKELGRAAYANPYHTDGFSRLFDEGIKLRAERIAEREAKGLDVERVTICPVCGVQSLVIYNEIYSNADNLVNGEELKEPYQQWRGTCQVKCMCCTFELHYNKIDNPRNYKLPIEDYWQSTLIS